MRRGYAGPVTVIAHGVDLTGESIYLTIKARGREITKTGSDLSVAYSGGATAIVFYLTQRETLSLPEGVADVQIRPVDADEFSRPTEIGKLQIGRVLKEGVLPYQGGESDE